MEPQNRCIECDRLWIELGRAIELTIKTSTRWAAAAGGRNVERLYRLESEMRNATSRRQVAQQAFQEHRANHAQGGQHGQISEA